MEDVSLEELQEQEHRLLDEEYDPLHGLSPFTATDKYMEINYARMGEDSEESAMRQKRSRKLLSERPLPSYQPY